MSAHQLFLFHLHLLIKETFGVVVLLQPSLCLLLLTLIVELSSLGFIHLLKTESENVCYSRLVSYLSANKWPGGWQAGEEFLLNGKT